MEGYIKSLSTTWRHIFKRAVRPGGKIPLEDLYVMYGEKHNLKPNEEFIEWLKKVKLREHIDTWEISVLNDKAPKKGDQPQDTGEKANDEIVIPPSGKVPTSVANKLSVEDVVALPVRKAREMLPNVTDVKLLQYALREARPRANKDSLCRLLDKRIQELKAGI